MFKVFDFFLKACYSQTLNEQISKDDEPGQQRQIKGRLHHGIDPSTAGADDRVRMRSGEEIEGKVVKRDVQQRQESEYARERGSLFLVRQVSTQHQVCEQRQQQNEFEVQTHIPGYPVFAPGRFTPDHATDDG